MSEPRTDAPLALPLPLVRVLIDAALAEDVGPGDATTLATVPADRQAEAVIRVREPGVLCGIHVAREVFRRVEDALVFEADAADGEPVREGQTAARVRGPARGILTAERTALNFLQHLSGIATATRRAVDRLAGTGVRILDTRKTVPSMRILAKYAVRCGGGTNHRLGLYDAMLIKDNHIAAAGGVTAAVERARRRYPDLFLEVEVRTAAELEEALAAGPDRVLLDNFVPQGVAAAVERIRALPEPRPEVELSGGITLENLADYALPGVDFISSGALTHSAPALDLALDLHLLEIP